MRAGAWHTFGIRQESTISYMYLWTQRLSLSGLRDLPCSHRYWGQGKSLPQAVPLQPGLSASHDYGTIILSLTTIILSHISRVGFLFLYVCGMHVWVFTCTWAHTWVWVYMSMCVRACESHRLRWAIFFHDAPLYLQKQSLSFEPRDHRVRWSSQPACSRDPAPSTSQGLWVLGIPILILMLPGQLFYPLSHLFSPWPSFPSLPSAWTVSLCCRAWLARTLLMWISAGQLVSAQNGSCCWNCVTDDVTGVLSNPSSEARQNPFVEQQEGVSEAAPSISVTLFLVILISLPSFPAKNIWERLKECFLY